MCGYVYAKTRQARQRLLFVTNRVPVRMRDGYGRTLAGQGSKSKPQASSPSPKPKPQAQAGAPMISAAQPLPAVPASHHVLAILQPTLTLDQSRPCFLFSCSLASCFLRYGTVPWSEGKATDGCCCSHLAILPLPSTVVSGQLSNKHRR